MDLKVNNRVIAGPKGNLVRSRVSETFRNSRVMGNSPSVECNYIRLLKQLLRSSGVKVKPESFDELFAEIQDIPLPPPPLMSEKGKDFSGSSDEGAFSDDDKDREQASKPNEMPPSQQNEISDILSNIIDWSPFDSARGRRGLKNLHWHRENNTIYSNTINDTIVWHARGFSPPGPHLNGYPIQKDLWKLMAALEKINAWVGHMDDKSGNHSLTFHKNVTWYTHSCVKLPYILLKGPAEWNKTLGIIMCKNCSLYTCINSSISFNIFTESLYIL
ncbi:hypothetical protein EI555_010272 [Monodon monoceros]|uniref:Uncharacterized protein n=1 Tax=Monodon monoceros TaxID=40151 RepID=A0A4U1EC31_MONMO|nr:hypothetical protein EI555_010272 [Monodon monoceros]